MGSQIGGIKVLGLSVEGVREEMQQIFHTVMISLNNLMKDKALRTKTETEENNSGGSGLESGGREYYLNSEPGKEQLPNASTQTHNIHTPIQMSQLSNLYLFFYNSLQALGWAISLVRILSNFFATKSVNGAYASAGELICLLQTLAFLEVIHGAIGIVPNGVLLPLMQWGGRIHVLIAIARGIDEVKVFSSIFMTFVAWCSIEVIRYPNYALNCFNISPAFLTYLRYTAFIVIYPTGLVGEMLLMYQALPFIKQKNLYANLFAGLPFSYYNFVTVVLLFYPLLWLKLYLHLFKQRRTKLGKYQKKKKN